MKKSKKIILFSLLLVFTILVITVYKVGSMFYFIPKEVNELNENMHLFELPFTFGEEVSEEELDKVLNLDWSKTLFYSDITYYNESVGNFVIRGFPDLSSSGKFAQYDTGEQNLTIFGIQVGSDINVAEDKLISMGYIKEYSDDYIFVKGKVMIYFSINENQIINQMSVFIQSSDWFHIGYYK
ncbi:hypothetical protein acsn021_19560 [Anaerocolumna cellulosilytica]|uniref:Uncharacterized protein n=1 Tax=Anaerocolumna cellulosilytica TaxID=433286 RepID=A0A6S6R2T7_9FIRM|nr:hypothetical protein [Anaerocolumna cellulosilytica]MBB5194651.1 hypothetical protein [Anaerocolumna cellulosilytica]BCJ94387.1 hypothetical protein acsn021_19560 [Anaerocolumna cellulosilytica]